MRVPMILFASAIIGWVAKTWSLRGAKESSRLVGGFVVKNISQTPYVVSIQIKRNPAEDVWEPICAGSLLSALYVITACHCVAKINSTGGVESLARTLPLGRWLFLAGAVDVTYPTWRHNPEAQNRTPEWIRHHPDCMLCQNEFLYSNVSVNDVAVGKMSKPFHLNIYVQPLELFSFYEDAFSVRLQQCFERDVVKLISGWGSTEFKFAVADFHLSGSPGVTTEDPLMKNKLKKIMVTVLQDDDHCRKRMYASLSQKNIKSKMTDDQWRNFSSMIDNSLHRQICSWTKSEGPCVGDDGAGVVCSDRNRWYILGVTSWGIGCGDGIASVAQYLGSTEVLSWIETESCSYQTCDDYQYAIDMCGPPLDDYFINCTFSTTTTAANTSTTTTYTTVTTTNTTGTGGTDRITHHELDGDDDSSARDISTNQLTMILAFFHYMIKLSRLRSQT